MPKTLGFVVLNEGRYLMYWSARDARLCCGQYGTVFATRRVAVNAASLSAQAWGDDISDYTIKRVSRG